MERNNVVVFDLDDTLYKEIDFLKSAFREIGEYLEKQFVLNAPYDELIGYYHQGKDAFQEIIYSYQLSIDKNILVKMYRAHQPSLCLDGDTRQALQGLKNKKYHLGIITDGRSVSQRNKIKALGLKEFIDKENILISDEIGHQKPDEYAFRWMEERYKGCDFIYVGDNPEKDFVAPNRLGWETICLMDDGRNIHGQNFNLPMEYLPKKKIYAFSELDWLM